MVRVPRILRDFSLLVFGGYLATAFQVVRGLILAGLLGPGGLGTVATVGIVLNYSGYADLGIGLGVAREIPMALGGGRDDEARSWAWHGLAAKLVAEVLVACGVLLYVLVWGGGLDPLLRFGLLTLTVVCVAQGVTSIQQSIFVANQRFSQAATTLALLWAVMLAAGVTGALLAGVRGVFAGQVVAFTATAVVGLMLGGAARPTKLDWSKVRRLLSVGGPLAVLAFAGYNLIYVDQIMVVSLLGTHDLGIYTLVLYAGTALYLLPASLSGVVSPRLLKRYGEQPMIEAIVDHSWRPVRVLTLVMPLLIVAMWLVGPLVIDVFLPAYREAIAPLRVYSIGVFFLGLNLGVSSTLVALNKHRYNIPILFAAITFNVCVDLLLVRAFGMGMAGIAVGSTLTYSAYWMMHTTLVRWFFRQSPARAVLMNLRSGWPGFALAAAVVLAWATGFLDRSAPLAEGIAVAIVAAITLWRWRRGGLDSPPGLLGARRD